MVNHAGNRCGGMVRSHRPASGLGALSSRTRLGRGRCVAEPPNDCSGDGPAPTIMTSNTDGIFEDEC